MSEKMAEVQGRCCDDATSCGDENYYGGQIDQSYMGARDLRPPVTFCGQFNKYRNDIN